MRKPDFSRRVAVTGLGIVSPVGADIPTAWANLTAGKSGPAPDHLLGRVRASSARPPARSTTSTPTPGWTSRPSGARTRTSSSGSPRPSRRPADAGLVIDASNADEVGVVLRLRRRWSGPDGGCHRDHEDAARARSARSSSPTCCPTPRPARSPSSSALAGRTCASSPPARRAPTTSARRPRASAAATSSRSSAARPRRPCSRSATSASATCGAWARRARDEGLTSISRPFDKTPQRLRAGRGRRRHGARGPRDGQGARRARLRRGRRLRLRGRRLGPHPAGREGRRHAAGHGVGARAPRRAARPDRPHQPPRHLHAAGRPARGAGHPLRLRRPDDGDRHHAAPSR